ncbi:MAG TPA: O-antigen ligase family protein [Gaiellaceae bacterium]
MRIATVAETLTPSERLRPAATAVLVGGAIVATSSAGGAYFPESWGWSGLAFLAALALVLLLAHSIAFSRLELAFVGAVAAFTAWVALSTIWSRSVTRTLLELERDLVYVAAVAALLTLAARCSARWMLAAVPAGSAVICAWALTSRTSTGGRLVGPIGYWNALGLLAAIGALVALGFAVEGARRGTAAAAPVLFVATLHLTYSRGAWLVLAAGLLVQLALSPARMRLVATVLVLAPACALAVELASRWDGVRFRLGLALLALAASAAPSLVDSLERRVRIGPRVRRTATIAAAVVGLAFVAFALVRAGGLGSTASRAYRSFTGPAPTTGAKGRTLLSVSSAGRAEYWGVAWRDFRHHPIVGSGAGTFALAWDRDRHTVYDVLDAHSLYIEVLGEMGVVGLLLVAGIAFTPLLALRRAPRSGVIAAAAGAYVAFLLHAGLDWDWEVPAVTFPGLACGCVLLVAARENAVGLSLRTRAAVLCAVGVVAAFVTFTYVGNVDLARGTRAYDRGQFADAIAQAERAARLLRWSADPWHLRGDAESGLIDREAAHRSYLRAVELDPHDWRLWYDVGMSGRGAERKAALARAARLNPLAREILGLKQLSSRGQP